MWTEIAYLGEFSCLLRNPHLEIYFSTVSAARVLVDSRGSDKLRLENLGK